MKILNIATYKFIPLTNLETLRDSFRQQCLCLNIKGTILLSKEGINISLSGLSENINQFKLFLKTDERFTDFSFRESYSDSISFKRLKVKIKKEIITMNHSGIHPEQTRAPHVSPEVLKQWLYEKRDMLLLDTRNDFEVQYGTFNGAVHLHLQHFSEFPSVIKSLPCDKPIVMFCTGGIRC